MTSPNVVETRRGSAHAPTIAPRKRRPVLDDLDRLAETLDRRAAERALYESLMAAPVDHRYSVSARRVA